MRSIEARLTDLEKRTGSERLTVFIVRFARPSPEHEAIGYSTYRDGWVDGDGKQGQRWDLRPVEIAEQLLERAEREVRRGPGGIAVLLERYAALQPSSVKRSRPPSE